MLLKEIFKKLTLNQVVVAHTFNSSTRVTEASEFLSSTSLGFPRNPILKNKKVNKVLKCKIRTDTDYLHCCHGDFHTFTLLIALPPWG